ncbi:MAG: hypothetical protein RQ864_07175 [Lutibacter sp.]|nr:hypothetical protein [Lutibacter sp.]MDT8417578.1 hypothetical protein [Lutibacter sp.]
MESYQYLLDYFENSPPIIKGVWILSAVFFISVIILTTYLKILRSRLRKNEKKVAEYQKEYESDLITYLYAGNEEDVISAEQQIIVDKLRSCASDEFKRRVIVSTLLRLRNEISGEMADAIQKLYFQSGLISFALKRLKSKKWYVVAKGIRELTQLHIKEVHDKIALLVNHPKKEIRKEVQLYLVTLFHFDGLQFLDVLQTQLSEWDQIQLLEVLQRFDEQEIPDINPWLKSTNDSVVAFALKLAKIYNQFEVKDTLIELLSHPQKKIRVDAIHVLSHLQVFEAKTILKNNFDKLSQEEQIEFFKLLENLCETSDEPFLLTQTTHQNFEIKLSVLKILKTLSNEKFKDLKDFSTDADYVKIYEFLAYNES